MSTKKTTTSSAKKPTDVAPISVDTNIRDLCKQGGGTFIGAIDGTRILGVTEDGHNMLACKTLAGGKWVTDTVKSTEKTIKDGSLVKFVSAGGKMPLATLA